MAHVSKSENSYITTSLLARIRGDGRAPTDYRTITLEAGVAPLANGSARARVGDTEVIAAIKLEAENVGGQSEGRDGGRIDCHVSWCRSLFVLFLRCELIFICFLKYTIRLSPSSNDGTR